MKHKKLFIVILSIALVLLLIGGYTMSVFCFLPKVAQMEEIVPAHLSQSFIITQQSKPTPACHASTICFFKGKLYSAWFGGTGEGKPDVTIWLSSLNDDVWSEPKDMSEIKNIAHYNPVLFCNDNQMFLFYKIGTHPDDWTTYVRSTFDGETWTEEKLMIEGDTVGRGPVKNKAITLSNGTVLAPASIEYKHKFPDVFVDSSKDLISWERGKNVRVNLFTEILQPSIVEVEDGHVLMFLRTNRKRVYFCESFDYGKTWSRAKATCLLNNNSGIDVAQNSDGVLAMVCNPVGEDWGARSPLIVALSYDKGKSWTKKITLESGEGEFSYPSIISVGNDFHITYTYKRELVAYAQITL